MFLRFLHIDFISSRDTVMVAHPIRGRILPLLCAVLMASPAAAQQRGGAAQPASPAEVLGHDLGQRFTDHAGVVRYMESLAAFSPRVKIRKYGESVEGRPLLQVLIAKEEHLARLDDILAKNRELAEPATSEARAKEIAATNPAVIYFSYGVHGNESSSSEAVMWTAWDLVRGAPSVAGVLDSAIVVLDPTVNPDGRDRYVNWYRQASGAVPNPNPETREHSEPWPGGRVNHYLFDLNRDWAWMSQPETRARLATWGYWTPQVHVDFHEMSANSSYFFFPAANPINPLYPDHILSWGKYFGAANAAAFDEQGWAYFTGESYDLFYPGYGDSWPSLLGAIGMTYEQAGGGVAGLAYKRADGTILTLRDRAEHHRTSGEATLRAAAGRKSELMLGFARFHRTVGEGVPDVLLVPGENPGKVEALVALLKAQGIRVERAERSFRVNAEAHRGFEARREFPAGTYRVPARQARGRLATTLLQPETVLKATFSYDISAWSLPYAYGVEAHRAERLPDAGWKVLEETVARPVVASTNGEAAKAREPYGYLVAPGFEVWPGVVRFLKAGGRARVLDREFTLEGKRWPRGTIFFPRGLNEGLGEKLERSGLAERVTAAATGRVSEGNDLGTGDAYSLELPRVAVLSGEGTSANSFGAHWFFLEQTLGLPFDAIPADRIGSVRLEQYDVLVLPDMGRGAALGERQFQQVEEWVRRGGTLVAVAGGARAAAGPVAGIKVRARKDEGEKDVASALRGREARELSDWEEQVPGTIFALNLDPAHPLAFGAGTDGRPDRLYVMHTGNGIFEPDASVETVAYFPEKVEKVSGVISDKNLKHLAQGGEIVLRRVGRGRAILFADDPVFRHFWYATFQPYVNALLIGPKM
jgi:hypothetical protein